MKSPARHPSPLTLLVALSILITLALAGAIIVLIIHSMQPEGPPTGLAGNTYITTAQTASGIDARGNPTDSTTSFRVGQTIYITYTVTDAGPGTVTIRLYNNGVFVDTMQQQFPQHSTYSAYFRFQATRPGDWEADLYWQQRGASGAGSLEQRVPFLVGASSALPTPFLTMLAPL